MNTLKECLVNITGSEKLDYQSLMKINNLSLKDKLNLVNINDLYIKLIIVGLKKQDMKKKVQLKDLNQFKTIPKNKKICIIINADFY